MKKIAFVLVTLFVFALFGTASAADKPMTPQQMDDMQKKHEEMMGEMHSIVLDTIALMKEIAPDAATKKKAADIEARAKKHFDQCKKEGMCGMHMMPGGGMGSGPMDHSKMHEQHMKQMQGK